MMNKPVEEFEISALIDGELDVARERAVRAAIERDPLLRSQFEALSAAHRMWTEAAASAQYAPVLETTVVTPPRPGWYTAAALLVCGLAAIRLLSKFLSVGLAGGFVIHGLMMVATVAAVVRLFGLNRWESRPGADSHVYGTAVDG